MVLHKNGALFTPFENQLDEIKKPRAKTKRQIVSTTSDILCISPRTGESCFVDADNFSTCL